MRVRILVAGAVALISALQLGLQGCVAVSNKANADSTGQETEVISSPSADSVLRMRAEVRRRIAESSTYLGHGLAEVDSVLRRWEDRTVRRLTYHVGANPAAVPGQGLELAVRRAFDRWERVGAIPVTFQRIRDSTLAEVHVHWIRSFQINRSGQADVYWDSDGWIRKATLTLATHAINGRPTGSDILYTVALHEIGHLLGLVHSDQPGDLMYPVTTASDLTARDRRSARLLYALPPGSVKNP